MFQRRVHERIGWLARRSGRHTDRRGLIWLRPGLEGLEVRAVPALGGLQTFAGGPSREKVTLLWNREDVTSAIGSQFGEEDSAKFIEWPKARYGLYQCDTVLLDGEQVGVSHDCGYIYNEKSFVSLASIDTSRAPIGSQVSVLWGESPNSTKPGVEPHVQVELRATVAPTPLVSFARASYRNA